MATSAMIEPIADPRNPDPENIDEIYKRTWGLRARVDPTVTFEEYVYWAAIERAEERETERVYQEEAGPFSFGKVLRGRFSHGVHRENEKKRERELAASGGLAEGSESEKNEKGESVVRSRPGSATQEEWQIAARALRTSSWGTVFFLITTDILGWSSTPFVFSSVGYVPAVLLYVIFGVAAFWSSMILWKVFIKLDSTRFPLQSYGDTFYRVYGRKSRHFINITQAIQQFATVAVLILGSGTTIAQLANEKLCFIVSLLIFALVGCCFGLIRSLQHIGWFANLSVWLNIVSFIIIMSAASHYGIDYQAVTQSTLIQTIEPVKTFIATVPNEYQSQAYGFAASFGGVNQMVYSWGGCLLFIAFMAEMRHPMDFWKGLLCAQVFIGLVYILFGAIVYHNYGQYSIINISNVIQPLILQEVNNYLTLFTGGIACLMYMNIGMKTVYIEVFQEAFGFPEITTRRGRWIWYALGPLYWALAFIVGAAVPNLNGVSQIVGALLILNFTFTFPALLGVGFWTQLGAELPGEGYNPRTGTTTRHDTGMKRWVRGYLKNWPLTTLNTVYFLGGLATCGMGSWSAITGLIQVFGPGGTVATSFGCASPV